MTKKMIEDQKLLREFNNIDKGKTGKISAANFRRLVFEGEPNQGIRSAAIDAYIAELSGHTGWITFQQFKQFMHAETQTADNPLVIAELTLAFNEVDTNKDGYISAREARKGITLAGQYIPGFSLDRIVHMFDDNHDGKLSLKEFLDNIKKIL